MKPKNFVFDLSPRALLAVVILAGAYVLGMYVSH